MTAIIISLLSLVFAIKSWHQSNRPIDVAYIDEDSMGMNLVTYNLVLANTGNRPAINIRIHATSEDIEKIFEENTPQSEKDIIRHCFEKESEVALLKNGTEILTSFGHYERQGNVTKGLKYDSFLPIKVMYSDLNNKKYSSSMSLKVRGLYGFGGAVWQKSKNINEC